MAQRIVAIFESVLMDHEKPEALYQAFLVAKEGFEEFERGKT